jgi:hypothetical protein
VIGAGASSLPLGREQSGDERGTKLGVRVGEQLYFSGCVFLQALDARSDSL